MRKDIVGVLRSRTTRLTASLACAGLLAACASGATSGKASSNDAAAYNVQLGIAYLQQGNLALAKEKLERAERQNPRDPNVHGALALLHERLGNESQVERHYRTALRLSPRNPELSNNFAVYLCRKGRVDEGVSRFRDAASNPLYRTPEAAHTNAGVCLRTAGRLEEAEESFLRAIDIRANFAEAVFQLADLQLQQGRTAEARTRLERFLGENEATPDLLLLGVRIARATGDRVAEERYARRLRVDFPGSEQTRALAELDRNPG
jgi:type IV pilus biogenesis/stability protein PilW|nr:MAG: type IV pilus biogenesis/stability protein PilW [Pseudomonadota bacterium]